MIDIIYLILLILTFFVLTIILLKVKVYVYVRITNIDVIDLKLQFSIKKIQIYTYKLYIRSGISKYINRVQNKNKQKNKQKNSIIDKIVKHLSKDKINLKIGVGLNDVITTNYVIVIITTILSFLCSKYIKLKNKKNINYNVLPIYNNSCIIFESMLKIKLIIIILFFISKKNKIGRK